MSLSQNGRPVSSFAPHHYNMTVRFSYPGAYDKAPASCTTSVYVNLSKNSFYRPKATDQPMLFF